MVYYVFCSFPCLLWKISIIKTSFKISVETEEHIWNQESCSHTVFLWPFFIVRKLWVYNYIFFVIIDWVTVMLMGSWGNTDVYQSYCMLKLMLPLMLQYISTYFWVQAFLHNAAMFQMFWLCRDEWAYSFLDWNIHKM